jgi:hypothetical protein
MTPIRSSRVSSAAAREEDDALLAACIFEALRFDPANPVIYRRATRDVVIARGHLHQIVISHDICHRAHMTRFGGWGYAHIHKRVLPLMRRRGFTEADLKDKVRRGGYLATIGHCIECHTPMERGKLQFETASGAGGRPFMPSFVKGLPASWQGAVSGNITSDRDNGIGAWTDGEIKRAQIQGLPDYPVFTTKHATDLSYLVCARDLLHAADRLYPQFATHNAHTAVAVRRMALSAGVKAYEYQRLHGMGEALYEALHQALKIEAPVRVYAPVGGHEDLLPYLVRRLLENGANTSFVHSFLDDEVAPERVAEDPIARVEAAPARHPRLPTPIQMFAPARRFGAATPDRLDCRPEGHHDREATAAIRLADHRYLAAVQFDHSGNKRQTQAGAFELPG